MAVTNFSPLLGLALPTTGDLSGTWGTTVNDSITGLIDSAVAGTATLSTDADVTLTTTNGAANQARNTVLLCTGARTTIKTITAPAQSKTYVVINATTGGFAVKLVGAGPTTGLTIPNGASAVVAWNGSDFVEVGSGSIGNLVVNGTLTVTGATSLQSTLAVTGAITNTAGTANGVTYLNGSKVLTSGSALVFDGTNLGVGATLPAGSGRPNFNIGYAGTGLVGAQADLSAVSSAYYAGSWKRAEATYKPSRLNISDGIFSWQTAAAGAIDSAITFADQMVLNATGLGIGTSSPAYKLDVFSGTNNSDVAKFTGAQSAKGLIVSTYASNGNDGGAKLSSTDSLAFSTASTERMRIDSSGNVGIGTTSPAAKLEVSGSTFANDVGGSTGLLRITSLNNTANNVLASFASTSTANNQLNVISVTTNVIGLQAHLWSTGANSDLAIQPNGGNVGIGVTPSAWNTLTTMQIKNASFSGYGNHSYTMANAFYQTGWKYIASEYALQYYQNATNGQHTWNIAPSGTAGNAITFTQAMTLFASGGLSLGNTTDPSGAGRMIIGGASTGATGTANTTTLGFSGNQISFNSSGSSYIATTYAGASLVFQTGAAVEAARIDSSGNLLVGATSAGNAKVTSVAGIAFEARDATQPFYQWYNSGAATDKKYWRTGPNTSGDLQWQTVNDAYNSASGKMTLDNAGNLGIGTSSPAAKLDVAAGAGPTIRLSNTTTNSGANELIGALDYYSADADNPAVRSYVRSYFLDTFGRDSYLTFATTTTGGNAVERVRIDNNGNLLVGATSTINNAKTVIGFTSSNNGLYINETSNTSGTQFVRFNQSSIDVGSITRVGTTSAVTYNTTSDYRLKTVVGAVSGSGGRIDALTPIDYQWKEDNSQARGFLAHEFQAVYPNSVTGGKDDLDSEGNPIYQSMQASSSEVIADLVAEIQSLRKRLADAGI